jgi:hypothetical protein
MIYDFGCSEKFHLSVFLTAMWGATAVWVVTAGMAAMMAMLRRRTEFLATDILCGWGIVAVAMTLMAIFCAHAWSVVAAPFAVFMFVVLYRAIVVGYFNSPFWAATLFPGMVILTALNLSGISGWDDFSHWVPNALYVFFNNGVPGIGMPTAHSAWPSYPYAVPFVTYLASHLAGGFLMQGAAMFNFLLLLCFGAMLTEIHAPQQFLSDKKITARLVGMTGLGLIVVTLANPGFNASFTMTNQGDTSIMVLVGALGLLFWRLVHALTINDRGRVNGIALQIVFTAMALVLVKQVGIYLLGLLCFAFLVVAVKNRVFKPRGFTWVIFLFVPALAMHLMWQHYVDHEMSNNGFGARPLSAWRFDLLAPLLSSMGQAIVKNNGLFMLVLLVLMCGGVSLFRRANPARNFALIAAIVCGGYLVFLFMSYLGANFSEVEIRRAASFYRYATHISLLGITFLWIMAPEIWAWVKQKKLGVFINAQISSWPQKARLMIIGVAVCFLPLALMVHGYWLMRGTNKDVCQYRFTGQQIADVLPDQAHLVTIGTEDGGFYGYVVGFDLALKELQGGSVIDIVQNIDISRPGAVGDLQRFLENNSDVNAILVQQSAVPLFKETSIGNIDMDNASRDVLFLRVNHMWKQANF